MDWKSFLSPTRIGMLIFLAFLLSVFVRVPLLGCFSYCAPDTMCTQSCETTPLFFLLVAALWTPSDTAHYAAALFLPMAAVYYLLSAALACLLTKRKKQER